MTVKEVSVYLVRQQGRNWPGSESIHRRPIGRFRSQQVVNEPGAAEV